ncbi:hypothetical protein E2C01_098954 [Portunus trituberculatus]|uniref:Uncharacterized protein n=1 Tax=Portunus trituberculatus TaxID=210409 RepID=A0A5B7JZ19_PORTR|nr:hypothetical protein [Portunus trituberculatus]
MPASQSDVAFPFPTLHRLGCAALCPAALLVLPPRPGSEWVRASAGHVGRVVLLQWSSRFRACCALHLFSRDSSGFASPWFTLAC